QNSSRSSGRSSTSSSVPWLKPADGPRNPAASTRSSTSPGMGRSPYERTIRRRRTTSAKSMAGCLQLEEDAAAPEGVGDAPPDGGDGDCVQQRAEQETGVRREQVSVQPGPPTMGLELGGEDLRGDEHHQRVPAEDLHGPGT